MPPVDSNSSGREAGSCSVEPPRGPQPAGEVRRERGDVVHAPVVDGGLEPVAVRVGPVGEPPIGEEEEGGDGHVWAPAQNRKYR